jgi:hypothetical protein
MQLSGLGQQSTTKKPQDCEIGPINFGLLLETDLGECPVSSK